MIRRVVLVGIPGSGKTSAGAVLADRLGWDFIDFDAEIVRRTGSSVADLFRNEGEVAFRAMEARLTAELSSQSNVVLAPGGGWAAQPGLLESLPPDSAVIWLRIAPQEAIGRLRGSPLQRPLLTGADPLAALSALATQRQHRYERADLAIDVDGRSIIDVAETITAWLRGHTS